VTPPDHDRSKFRNRFPAGQKPSRNEGANWASRERGKTGDIPPVQVDEEILAAD